MQTDIDARIERLRELGIPLKQHLDEMRVAYNYVANYIDNIDRFLEVGSLAGASLYAYAGLVPPGRDKLVIALDDGRRPRARRMLKRAIGVLQAEHINATWVRGNSHAEDTQVEIVKLLGGKPLDFLHIDGDHSAAGSWDDWITYGSLVRSGGLVAFHDVCAAPPSHVAETWRRICDSGLLTRVIVRGPFQITPEGKVHKECGIGLVYIP